MSNKLERASLLPRPAADGVGGLAAQAQLAFTYLRSSIRRESRNWRLGVATIALVVAFSAILQAGIETAPVLFLKLAEGQTGETDLTLLPEVSADVALPLLNFTCVAAALELAAPRVRGAAPRWALPVTLASKAEPGRRTAAILLAIDSDAEARIGLGRAWGRRRLGEEEAYVAASALLETGVAAGAGERVVASYDVGALLAAVGGGAAGGAGGGGAANTTQLAGALTGGLLAALGLGTVPADGAAPDALGALAAALDAAGLLGGNASALLAAARPGLPGAAALTLAPLVAAAVAGALATFESLAAEYSVLDAIADPGGKYPSLLGNVLVVEAAQLAVWLRGALLAVLGRARASLAPVLALSGGVADALAGALASLEARAAAFSYADMRSYAMTISVMAHDRLEWYLRQPPETADFSVADMAASVAAALGDAAPLAGLTLLPDTLAGLRLLGLFLAQIFTIVIAVLAALSVVVTYSLVGGDLEAKTYELGMLRALGMRRATLSQLLALNTAAFALPGLAIGLAVASIANVGIVYGMGWYVGLTPNDFLGRGALPPSAWGLAVGLGVVMPAVAVVVPIARALGASLRDALDLYHTSINALSVTVSKLKGSWGVDPSQTAVAVLLATAGVCTFVVLPQAFLGGNLSLFLGLLSAVLLAMLLGLTLVALSLQGAVEAAVLAALTGAWTHALPRALVPPAALDALLPDRRLHMLASKHLAGHRTRNAQTAAMVATTVAFIVFASALFSLQGASITTNVKMLLGADIVAFVPEYLTNGLALPQDAMADFLGRSRATSNIVAGFSFVSLPLTSLPFIRRTQVANLVGLPRTSTRVYGVQRNLLDVAFAEYALVTEARGEGLEGSAAAAAAAPAFSSRAAAREAWALAHPVWALYDGAGGLRLPVEAAAGLGSGGGGASAGYPAPLLSGEAASPLYVCGDDVGAAAGAGAAGADAPAPASAGAWDPSLGWRWEAGSGRQWPPLVDAARGGPYARVSGSPPTGPNRSSLPAAQLLAAVAVRERARVAAAAASPLLLPAYGSYDLCVLACSLRPLPPRAASAAAVLAAACNASGGGALALRPAPPLADGFAYYGLAKVGLAAGRSDVCGGADNATRAGSGSPPPPVRGLPRPCVAGSQFDAARQQRDIHSTYLRYVDSIMSESLRSSASLDTATPLQVRVQVRDPATGDTATTVYMSKARAMARKMPGFFFSSYSTLGGRAPILTRMVDYARLLDDARASYAELQASASPSPSASAAADASAAPASVVASSARAWPPTATWVASDPAWLLATVPALPSAASARAAGSGGVVAAPVGAFALDANASTALLAPPANSSDVRGGAASGSLARAPAVNVTGGLLLTLDLGRCALLAGIRLGAWPRPIGSATAAAATPPPLVLQLFALSDAAASGYKLVGSLDWNSSSGGGSSDVALAPFSGRFWAVLARPALSAAPPGEAAPLLLGVPELTLRLAEPPASGCKAPELAPDDALSAAAAPKQRLLVKLQPGASGSDRQRVLNGLRSALSAAGGGGGGSVNSIRVQDTAELLASASLALLGLDILFYFVSAIALTLCFFAAWLSFTSVVKEGATELAVMRALGLSAGQVVRVFVYEALAVVLGAFVTGTAVGLAVSVSLSLQLGLFLELPFDLRFGYGVFIFMLLVCTAMAVAASALPARALTRLPVAAVIKGRT